MLFAKRLALSKISCPFDVGVNAVMRRRQHDFSIVRQRTRGNYEAGQTETFTRRLYVHVCYKLEAAPIQERRLKESHFFNQERFGRWC